MKGEQDITGKPLIFYFQVHQPRRLKEFQFLNITENEEYFDDTLNEQIISRVSEDCYLPVNRMLLDILRKNPGLKISFSISGVVLDQLEKYAPDVIKSFKSLVDTDSVEFLSSTYHHSMAWKISESEFLTQVIRHAEKIRQHFDCETSGFANAELIYNNDIGAMVSRMGFNGILTDSSLKTLKPAENEFLYRHPTEPLDILLRQTKLSEDIVFRFGAGKAKLNVDEYFSRIVEHPGSPLLLGMSYETFGETLRKETGIIDFLRDLTTKVGRDKMLDPVFTPELFRLDTNRLPLSVDHPVSWMDEQKDISAWLGNDLQQEAFAALKALEPSATKTSNEQLTEVWRHLQTCDHFYYMSTKRLSEGSLHSYYSHYASPYEAYINYMNILSDLTSRIKAAPVKESEDQHAKALEYGRQHPSAPVWAMKKEGSQHRHF